MTLRPVAVLVVCRAAVGAIAAEARQHPVPPAHRAAVDWSLLEPAADTARLKLHVDLRYLDATRLEGARWSVLSALDPDVVLVGQVEVDPSLSEREAWVELELEIAAEELAAWREGYTPLLVVHWDHPVGATLDRHVQTLHRWMLRGEVPR